MPFAGGCCWVPAVPLVHVRAVEEKMLQKASKKEILKSQKDSPGPKTMGRPRCRSVAAPNAAHTRTTKREKNRKHSVVQRREPVAAPRRHPPK